ncbi:Uncharacterised protein [Vibrio cholerae]|nr:Uncharacterised protein [Vibrio cholerae]CSC84526.1 Uncharacterised protein [Vibrio cholerae]CSD10724.1 Uncharacterised protein [Vibrio cholerae]CSD54380.1 Uncharacterised protein [Vibrio cholerae]CSI78481.1 Uncharacterised protein [Vibrio cholerae]
MSITAETVEKARDLFMNHSVTSNDFLELFILLTIRGFTVKKDVTHFQVISVIG